MAAQPLDDLEMFDLLQAAYPEKFSGEDDETWEAAQKFAEEMPVSEVDHINHNGLDNRWVNLRQVTRQENCKNTSLYKRNKSGVSGVAWNKRDKKWMAEIGQRPRRKLGRFIDKFEAICARKSAENKLNYHPNHGR